jgi:CspA family cold shock protein
MDTGTVKWYSEKKEYGFITQNTGVDIFFHRTGIKETGFRSTLKEGDKVTFEVRQGQKGKQAYNVTRV